MTTTTILMRNLENLAPQGLSGFEVSTFETVDLSDATCIAAGAERDVYQHPVYPDLLIKTINHRRERALSPIKRWQQRYRRENAYRVFLSEITEYIAASVRGCDARGNLLMARIAGLVWTNQGLGLAVEKIVDDQGNLAPTVWQLVDREGFSDSLHVRLDQFFRDLADSHVVFNDVSSRNIVFGRNSQGREGLYLVDGYGPKQAVPVYAWSKKLNRRRLVYKYDEMLAKLESQSRSLALAC